MNEQYDIQDKARQVIEAARAKNLRIISVESCTGGLLAAALTETAGASDVVEGGFVTYANQAKMAFVGVPEILLTSHGAVSMEVAIAMAEGGLQHCDADIALSITGIAGPGGGSTSKPVGLVHFAIASRAQPKQHRIAHFENLGRLHVRHAAVVFALNFLLEHFTSLEAQ